MSTQFLRSTLVLCMLGAGLSACAKDDSATSATPEAAASSAKANAKAISYEVVTVQRPEDAAKFHSLYKAAYDFCTVTLKVKGLPLPPMKQPPPDYVLTRRTYLSDGNHSYRKQENFIYEVVDSPDPTNPSCETRERKSVEIDVLRDGKHYYGATDENGNWHNEEPEEFQAGSEKDELYIEPRVIKGVAVKCMKQLPGMDKLISYQCAADLKPGTLFFGAEPIIVADRVLSAEKIQGPIVVEPVLVKTGHKVDPKTFDVPLKP